MDYNFKKTHNLTQRKNESERIKGKYPERIPVIVEVYDKILPHLDKNKYLVPSDLTVGQLQYVLRKRIKLSPDQAMFLFINQKNSYPTGSLLSEIYDKNVDEDGFLYISISAENTFG
jgi:GABA(A) receptor-associated protein